MIRIAPFDPGVAASLYVFESPSSRPGRATPLQVMRKHSSFKTILSMFPEKSSIDHLNCIKWCYVNGYARSAEENEPLDRAFDRMALPVAASMLAGASLAHYTSFSLLPKRHSVLQSVFSAAIAVSLAERKIFDRVFDRIALPDAAHTPEPASPSRKPETHACSTARNSPPLPSRYHAIPPPAHHRCDVLSHPHL